MPDPIMDQNQDQAQQPQLTLGDLSELHGIARQLQDAGDPRAARIWDLLSAQSGDGSAGPSFTIRQTSPQPSSWQDDLDNEIGGSGAAGASESSTADFLDNLSGIGFGAYMTMRDPDLPAYKDWRRQNFVRNGSGSYVSRDGEEYSNDDLKQTHGVLSRQAGNPLISSLFGPIPTAADYLVWRNQNYNNDHEVGGAWEDDDGGLYSEEALQQEFAAKSAAQSKQSNESDQQQSQLVADSHSAPQTSSVGQGKSPTRDHDQMASASVAAQFPFFQSEPPPPPPPRPPSPPPFAFDQARIRELTVEQVAGIVFNENRDVMPGESTPQQLQEAKTAQAHAIINGDRTLGTHRPESATPNVSARLKATPQYQQALLAARTAFQEDNIGADPTGGRIYFNNRFEGQNLAAPRILNGSPQDPHHTYGPFTVGGGKVWTVIYDATRN